MGRSRPSGKPSSAARTARSYAPSGLVCRTRKTGCASSSPPTVRRCSPISRCRSCEQDQARWAPQPLGGLDGIGPYRVTRATPAVVELEPADTGVLPRPRHAVVIRSIRDENARALRLLAGRADIAPNALSPTLLPSLDGRAGLTDPGSHRREHQLPAVPERTATLRSPRGPPSHRAIHRPRADRANAVWRDAPRARTDSCHEATGRHPIHCQVSPSIPVPSERSWRVCPRSRWSRAPIGCA